MLVRLLCMRLYSQLLIVLHRILTLLIVLSCYVASYQLRFPPCYCPTPKSVAAYGTYVALTLQSTYFKNKTQHMESYTISDIVANGGVRSFLILWASFGAHGVFGIFENQVQGKPWLWLPPCVRIETFTFKVYPNVKCSCWRLRK